MNENMTDISPDADERYIVPGLLRGLQMLQTFTGDLQEQTVGQMARAVGASRSTAFRIVYTLEAAGFLRRIADTHRYQLGSRVLELGHRFLAGKDLIEVASPVLRRLRDDTSASSHIAVREGREVVYVARIQGNTSLISTISVGSRLPAHATAPGRLLLAGVPLSEVVALYEDYAFETYTPQTPGSMGALVSLVEEDRKEPSIVSWGFYESDLASIAAPVFDAAGKLEAAISISCPIKTFEEHHFRTVIRARVEEAAADVSRARGFQGRIAA